jgi:Domain of unknown function (DUF4260)
LIVEAEPDRIELEQPAPRDGIRKWNLDGEVDAARACGQSRLEGIRPVRRQHERNIRILGKAAQLGLIWFTHIGVDRALGYGLKYPTGFKDTHLQRV